MEKLNNLKPLLGAMKSLTFQKGSKKIVMQQRAPDTTTAGNEYACHDLSA